MAEAIALNAERSLNIAVADNEWRHHDRFDWPLIKQHAPLIVDSRGVYREPAANVVKA